MSSTLFGLGFIAELVEPLTDEREREEVYEKLWMTKSKLGLNHEGTLLIYNYRGDLMISEQADLYHFHVGPIKGSMDEFLMLAHRTGLFIKLKTIQPWSCVWYNGTDSPQSELTLADFQKNYLVT